MTARPALQPATLAVVGLGYVGLPLAVALGKHFRTIGFDSCSNKLSACQALQKGGPPVCEIDATKLAAAPLLEFSSTEADLARASIVIIAVPTPVDARKQPDLSALRAATLMVARHLAPGATVVFESTVYPGATEGFCVPLLEQASKMRWKRDFFVAYSPERINAGDSAHGLENIVKVVAGDTPETLARISDLYQKVAHAGVHQVSSLAVAEAAKVIENTQRDVNIALVNELSLILHRLGIDTQEVLDAAATKWNFARFEPGLVGGHCIGVDPYYLTHLATQLGYHPEVILAGRRINDSMATYVASQIAKGIVQSGRNLRGAHVLVLGLTFKENCADLRNSQVARLASELQEFGCNVSVFDPLADSSEARELYGIELAQLDLAQLDRRAGELRKSDSALHNSSLADALVLAVPHAEFLAIPLEQLLALTHPGAPVFDIKSRLDKTAVEAAGFPLFRL